MRLVKYRASDSGDMADAIIDNLKDEESKMALYDVKNCFEFLHATAASIKIASVKLADVIKNNMDQLGSMEVLRSRERATLLQVQHQQSINQASTVQTSTPFTRTQLLARGGAIVPGDSAVRVRRELVVDSSA